jgi:ankyrin repeat protein
MQLTRATRRLADDDADPDSKDEDKNGQTPLSFAAQQGHKQIVEMLLARLAEGAMII